VTPGAGGPLATVPPGPLGIPGVMLDAYLKAEQRLALSHPTCGLHWSVLAAIGRIESGHARGGAVDANGTTIRPILGPQLSGGPGIAAIRDSDGGLLDGDSVWDRAVGPMQFIPTTWAGYSADGNDDGTVSPHNIYDSTVAAGKYLCADRTDLRDPVSLARAIFRYNHSDAYVAKILAWAAAYANGVTPLPSSPAPIEEPVAEPQVPDPTTPPGTTPPPTTNPPSTTTPPPSTTDPTTTPPTCPTTPPSTTDPTSPTSPTPSTTVPPECETTTPPPPPSSSTTTAAGTTPANTSESSANSSTGTTTGTSTGTSTETTTDSGQPTTTTSLPPT
jgi:hypothetical protein